jgi:hypothetical protein
MGYVAPTAALFALGAYLGRNLPGGASIVSFIAAFACLIGMQFAARGSRQLTVGLLGTFGLSTGLALTPVLTVYASMDPQALWQAGESEATQDWAGTHTSWICVERRSVAGYRGDRCTAPQSSLRNKRDHARLHR